HVKLGSRQVEESFESIEDAHKEDIAFTNFQVTRLVIFSPTLLHYTDMVKQVITECCFLKVNYKSIVDWRQHTDYLQCSPKFYGCPHFNCVFIQMTD
ncbi:hypothetical protein P692DRAFT_20743524, partial [Suillus brevipes Sb2]